MRYCPNCNKQVDDSIAGFQLVLLITLTALAFLPGVLYLIFHPRRCPYCRTRTIKFTK